MLPYRMNPVEIKIRQFNHQETNWDEDFREPWSDESYDGVITVRGQVNLGGKTEREVSRTNTGDAEPSYAWLVFRKRDLDEASPPVVLKKADKVIEIAGEAVDFVIRELRTESPLRGRFLLLYAILEAPKEVRVA